MGTLDYTCCFFHYTKSPFLQLTRRSLFIYPWPLNILGGWRGLIIPALSKTLNLKKTSEAVVKSYPSVAYQKAYFRVINLIH
jgi:hypothetical protein